VPTPFSYLNKITRGYQDGDLIIQAARPSQGKTARAIQEAVHCAKEHGPAGFISLEMSDEALVQRVLAQGARVNIRRPLTGEEWERLTPVAGNASEYPLHIVDTPGLTATQIRGQIRRLYYEHGITAAWVDYLNEIPMPTTSKRHDQDMGDACRILRETARELEIPVILLAQLSRKPEQRDPERPRKSDLRDSGQIEEKADVIIMQWLPDEYDRTELDWGPDHREQAWGGYNVEGLAEIIVEKQRKGATGAFWLQFTPEHTLFSDLQTTERAPHPADTAESPF